MRGRYKYGRHCPHSLALRVRRRTPGRGGAYPATTFAAVCNAGHRAYILPVPYRTSARFRTPGVGIRTPGAGRTPRAANSYLPRTPTYRELRLTASMEKTPQILRVINQ
ncbi:hypothetical protein [Actinobaculum suis]|uniref:hypothetical protein n=1 Tax=Actinobaculum suis TaxID=1657 RepID=UPI00163B8208|nr:hypothetical protein [Actinobaculum suis]